MHTTTWRERECERVPVRGDPRARLPPPTAESIEAVLGGEGVRLLSEAGLESRVAVEERLREIVRTAEAYSRSGAGQSLVAVVVGEWGLGKSHAARTLRRHAPAGLRVETVVFDDLVDEVDRLYQALGRPPSEGEAKDAILARLTRPGLPALVVIDEVESLISAVSSTSEIKRTVAEAFFDLVKALLNPEIAYASGVRGQLHLVLLLTPAAFNSLRTHLQERGIGGKLLRRFEIVRLRPLEKYETISLARAFLKASLGLDPEQAFSDPRLLEVIHEVSGGNPGNAIGLLVQVLRHAACSPGEECICRVTPQLMLEALTHAVLVDEAGETYPALDRHLAETVREYSQGDPEAIILALGSISPLGRAGKAREALARAGLQPVEVGVVVLGGPAEARRWVSTVSRQACGDDPDCRQSLSSALSHLLHLDPQGRLVAAVPADPGTLVGWLEYLGWEPREPGVERLAAHAGRGEPGWLVVPPERLSRILTVHTRRGVPYIRDPAARERLRERLRRLEQNQEEYARRIADGLSLVLRMVLEAEPAGLRLRWKATYRDVLYEVLLEADPSLLHRSAPVCGKRAVLRLLVHHEEDHPETSCPLHVPVPLPHGIAQRLALMALAYEQERDLLDKALLQEEAEDIAKKLGLEERLTRILPRLEEAGILVQPHSRGLQLALELMNRHVQRAGRLLADTHRLLVALGGGRRPVAMQELADAIEALARATPYSDKKRRWCGAPIPSFSVLDIKDESPQNLRTLVSQSLAALEAEGIARADGVRYQSSLAGDPIACRLLYARPDDKKLHEYYILPINETLRAQSIERIRARREAAAHLGLEEAAGPWPCRIVGPRLAGRPASPGEARRLVGRLQASRDRLQAELGVAPRRFPALVVCKKKACKTVTIDNFEATASLLETMLEPNRLYPAEEEMARSILGLLARYAELVEAAIDDIIESYRETQADASSLRSRVAEIITSIRVLQAQGLDPTLADRLVSALRSLERIASGSEIKSRLTQAVTEADRIVDRVEEKHNLDDETRRFFEYSRCESSFQLHAYTVARTLAGYRDTLRRLEERLENAWRQLDSARRILEALGEDRAHAVLSTITITSTPDPDETPEMIAAGIEQTAVNLLAIITNRIRIIQQDLERIEAARRIFNRLPSPDKLEKEAPAPEEAEKLAGWAKRLSHQPLTGTVEDLETVLRELYAMIEEYEEDYNHLARAIDEQCGKHPDQCYELANKLNDKASRIQAHTSQAKRLLEKAHNMIQSIIKEEKERLEQTINKTLELLKTASTTPHAENLGTQQLLQIDQALKKAEQALREAEKWWLEDPPTAATLLTAARKSLEETIRILIPEEHRKLYDILIQLREEKELLLEHLLEIIEDTGWPREKTREALDTLVQLAKSLGIKIHVKIGDT